MGLFDELRGVGQRAVEDTVNELLGEVGKHGAKVAKNTVKQAVVGNWGERVGRHMRTVNSVQNADRWPRWYVDALMSESGCVVPIVGQRDMGKTTYAVETAEFIQKQDGSNIYFVGYPPHLAPAHIIPVPLKDLGYLMKVAPDGSIVILDDVGSIFNSKRTMEDAGIEFEGWVNTVAHGQRRILMTIQDSSDLNKAGLRASVMAFKPPERMFEATERSEMRPIIRLAQAAFNQVPRGQWREHIWIYRDPEQNQMLKVQQPKWLTRSRAKWRGRGGRTEAAPGRFMERPKPGGDPFVGGAASAGNAPSTSSEYAGNSPYWDPGVGIGYDNPFG